MAKRRRKPYSADSKRRKWVSHVPSDELFWYLPGVDFSVLQHYVKDIVRRATTSLHFVSHLIDRYSPTFQFRSFHFSVSVRPICSVRPVEVSFTCQIWHSTFRCPEPLIYTCWSDTRVSPQCLFIQPWISAGFSSSLVKKWIIVGCSPVVRAFKRVAIFDLVRWLTRLRIKRGIT